MPRMQVYLPDDLYRLVKTGRLPASELLQQAVRVEARRRELLRASDKYVAELTKQVGRPGARESAGATASARQIAERRRRKAG